MFPEKNNPLKICSKEFLIYKMKRSEFGMLYIHVMKNHAIRDSLNA